MGQGGMAEVFKAIKSGPDGFSKTVALKRILPFQSDQPHFIRMLSTEAKINSYLSHPNIVQIFDFFEENGQYCMTLEFVDGKNLKEIMVACKRQRTTLPWQACLYVALETLKALFYAHQKIGSNGPLNIIHRDVSPHNILVSYQGEIKLSDFGIARAQIERDETASGILKGKYRYVSPEQILAESLMPSSDLFSLAVTLYEMLSLEHPFGELQEYQTLQKIIDQPHMPLLKLKPDIKPEISHILDQAMQKRPLDRYQNARDFYEDLLEVQDQSWKTHGGELLSEILINLIPVDQRSELEVEKTTPLLLTTKHSLLEPSIKKRSVNKFRIIGATSILILASFWVMLKPKKITEAPIAPTQSQPTKVISSPISEPAVKKTVRAKPSTPTIKKAPPVVTPNNNGEIDFSGPPSTHIYINGKEMGVLPISPISIPPGTYTVLLMHDQMGRKMKTIDVKKNQTSKVTWQ